MNRLNATDCAKLNREQKRKSQELTLALMRRIENYHRHIDDMLDSLVAMKGQLRSLKEKANGECTRELEKVDEEYREACSIVEWYLENIKSSREML